MEKKMSSKLSKNYEKRKRNVSIKKIGIQEKPLKILDNIVEF